MEGKPGAAGLAALAICESLLLSLTENKVLGASEARAILEDAAAANRNAIPLASDGTNHEAALVRPPAEDRLDDVRRQQCQPQDPASVIGPRVSIPHSTRRVAELVLLSVVDARPPHDAIRWSGRANLTCVVQLRSRPPPDPRLYPIHASPRRDLVAG
jgi:hypothetical protein